MLGWIAVILAGLVVLNVWSRERRATMTEAERRKEEEEMQTW